MVSFKFFIRDEDINDHKIKYSFYILCFKKCTSAKEADTNLATNRYLGSSQYRLYRKLVTSISNPYRFNLNRPGCTSWSRVVRNVPVVTFSFPLFVLFTNYIVLRILTKQEKNGYVVNLTRSRFIQDEGPLKNQTFVLVCKFCFARVPVARPLKLVLKLTHRRKTACSERRHVEKNSSHLA